MSEILVNKLTGTSTAGSILVTGEGNSTTTNLQQGLTKAWVYCTPSAIGDSHNHSSFTDNGTGDHTLGLTNAMASAVNYTTMTMGSPQPASYNRALTPYGGDKTTTATRYKGGPMHTAGTEDLPGNMFVINGDLA